MSINYYCSGFDNTNAFFKELENNFKNELTDTKSIVYIPAGEPAYEKARDKYVPIFTEHFRKIGIKFDNVHLISPNMDSKEAKELVDNANFIMLMGGNPFLEKKLVEELDIVDNLKKFNGVMLGYSAGAMLMSKYIIIVPCSEEYPDFHIEKGLGLSNVSIYPHNNFEGNIYPEYIDVDGEITKREDLIKVAKEYGDFYLLQDYYIEDGKVDVSLIRTYKDNIDYITYQNGKIFKATKEGIILEDIKKNLKKIK